MRKNSPSVTHAVRVMAETRNSKLGRCAATYVNQSSCPPSCPFLHNGCYAETGPMSWGVTRHVNAGPAADPVALAAREAELIAQLPGDRDLRLHVVGDSRTRRGTRLLARAAARYAPGVRVRRRGRLVSPVVFTYTHSWRSVPRGDWGPVSVLASCETPAQVRAAWRRGYAASLVVPTFERAAAYPVATGVTLVPCPAQTHGTTCVDCRLCFDDARLLRQRLVIGFAAHGARKNRVTAAVTRRVSLQTV